MIPKTAIQNKTSEKHVSISLPNVSTQLVSLVCRTRELETFHLHFSVAGVTVIVNQFDQSECVICLVNVVVHVIARLTLDEALASIVGSPKIDKVAAPINCSLPACD